MMRKILLCSSLHTIRFEKYKKIFKRKSKRAFLSKFVNHSTMPSKPKDAASLIIINQDSNTPRVLMGRRPDNARFMPGVWVFPGGAVSQGDGRISSSGDISKADVKNMAVASRPSRARTLAIAAIRETFEETGIMLGRRGDVGMASAESELAWRAYKENRVIPDLDKLQYAGRALTPAYMPIRFHARFFTANANECSGSLKENGELLDLCWMDVSDALRQRLADITEFMLNQVLNNGKSTKFNKTALFTYRYNRRIIRFD